MHYLAYRLPAVKPKQIHDGYSLNSPLRCGFGHFVRPGARARTGRASCCRRAAARRAVGALV
eukprot:3144354-Alexandrium_andersonii.AAC.1